MLKFITIILLAVSSACFAQDPQVTAKAWLVANEGGQVIEGQNASDVRSIASITKLLTVMIVLDAAQPLDEVINTKKFKKITRGELINLALVHSDNDAALILCQQYVTGYQDCIHMMNARVQGLEMYDTVVYEPTGRNRGNVSTAKDLLKLVQAASFYPEIVAASNTRQVLRPGKKKPLVYVNTNSLVGNGYDFLVSKTGFISTSGGCIVMMLNTINGVRTVVLLGSKNTKTRIPEAAFLSTYNENIRIN
jgi:serine-type D-Ala-D-Ala endopeptidase (penicillin-binding protein 7)